MIKGNIGALAPLTSNILMAKDPYEILGISRSASEDEIKRAYRKLAQQHHPDRNKDDKSGGEKFKEINAAYEILSDKQKRQTYDQYGEQAFQGGRGGAEGGFDFGNFAGFGDSFSDIFETFFSGTQHPGSQKRGATPGEDREASVTISFEEAAFGTEKEVKVARIGLCEKCGGGGAMPGSKIVTCGTCQGKGEVRSVRNTIIGQVSTRRVCGTCHGLGKVPEAPCDVCHGGGRSRVVEKLRVKIPAGVGDNSSMRISGKGDAGIQGGESGDLYVRMQILPHKKFARKDSDVYSEEEIAIPQAVLGDIISVETIQGVKKLKIPAGTASGKVFRIKDAGVSKLRGDGFGQHFVTVKIKIPEALSRKERELFRALAEEGGITVQEEKGFLKKIIGE